MRSVEVILQQDYPKLGFVGDRIRVKGGYARNYLIPKNIAFEASAHNERELKHRLGSVNAKRLKLRSEAENVSKSLQTLRLEYFLRIGEGGRAFGSVTTQQIENGLKEKGFLVEKSQISVSEPIRKVGEHTVKVKLHSEVTTTLTVVVNSEVPPAAPKAAADDAEKKSKAKGRGRKTKSDEDSAEQFDA